MEFNAERLSQIVDRLQRFDWGYVTQVDFDQCEGNNEEGVQLVSLKVPLNNFQLMNFAAADLDFLVKTLLDLSYKVVEITSNMDQVVRKLREGTKINEAQIDYATGENSQILGE